jgi:hypothetical protein
MPGPPASDAAPARDRDEAGRARNARPRDGLGRPLPHGAPGIPTMPDDPALPPRAALDLAQRLLDENRPFHAHEVLEATWKAAPPAERELWRGLAQLAVGLTHARRGNPAGAVTLLRRGADRITSADWPASHGVDTATLAAAAHSLAEQIASDGTDVLPPGRLLPPLQDPATE